MSTKREATPLRTTDALVAEYADLTERIEGLAERREAIRAELATLPLGTHETPSGPFTVRAPSRRFDLAKADALLTPEQRQVCFTLDARLVKRQLPEVLLETCYVAGNSPNVVTFK